MENEGKGKSPDFESIKQTNVYDIDFWISRDRMGILGYHKWERFEEAIKRAMESCEQNSQIVEDHFPSVGKMISLGKGGQREIKDYHLSKYACHLIAINGDPRTLLTYTHLMPPAPSPVPHDCVAAR